MSKRFLAFLLITQWLGGMGVAWLVLRFMIGPVCFGV